MPVTVSKSNFNLREILNSLKQKVGTKGAELLRADTVDDAYNVLKPVMYRNLIINGGFQVAQRGTSFTDPGGYTLDRWASQSNHTGTVISQQSFTPGQTVIPGNPHNYYRAAITFTNTAADRVALMHRIENYKPFVGRPVVLSGWYRCTANLIGANWLFQMKRSSSFYDNSTELADTVGPLPPTSQWTYFTRKVFVPSNTLDGQTMTATASFNIMYYYQSASVAGNLEFANLQLEIGEQPTPFEYRPPQVELELCKRYCQVFGGTSAYEHIGQGAAYTSGNAAIDVTFTPEMRAVPSISASGNWAVSDGITNTAVTSYSLASNGGESSGKRLGLVALTGGTALTQFRPYVLFPNNDTSAKFIASAEL
jgi:hypothetical protein